MFGVVPDWIVGVIVASASCLITSCAIVMQKVSHIEDHQAAPEEHTNFLLRPKWWLAVLVMLGSSGLSGWSLALAPLSMVAPLSGETVVWNLAFAVYLLGEKTNRLELSAMIFIIVGMVLAVLFGPHHTHKETAMEEVNAFVTPRMLIYGCSFMAIVGLSLVLIGCTAAGKRWAQPRVNSFAYAHLAGLIGGQSQLFFKCGVMIMSNDTFETHPIWWVMTALLISVALIQLVVFNTGLEIHDAVTYVPIYQAGLSVYGSVAGGVYFEEFRNFTSVQMACFVGGVSLVDLGLLMPLWVSIMRPGDVEMFAGVDAPAQELFENLSPRSQSPGQSKLRPVEVLEVSAGDLPDADGEGESINLMNDKNKKNSYSSMDSAPEPRDT